MHNRYIRVSAIDINIPMKHNVKKNWVATKKAENKNINY